jgi:hypothetical protein
MKKGRLSTPLLHSNRYQLIKVQLITPFSIFHGLDDFCRPAATINASVPTHLRPNVCGSAYGEPSGFCPAAGGADWDPASGELLPTGAAPPAASGIGDN